MNAFAAFVAFLGFDRQGRRRTGFQTTQADGFARVLAVAVGAVLDPAQRIVLRVDTAKAALNGIPVAEVARVARLALAGEDITPIHDGHSKYTVPVRVGLPSSARGSLDAMLKLKVRGQDEKGQTYEVALAELVRLRPQLLV